MIKPLWKQGGSSGGMQKSGGCPAVWSKALEMGASSTPGSAEWCLLPTPCLSLTMDSVPYSIPVGIGEDF